MPRLFKERGSEGTLTDTAEGVMDHGDLLTVFAVWWAWDHPLIRSANNAVLLETCLSATEQALALNASDGRTPSNWKELESLAGLPRDPRNIRRVFQGQINLTTEFLLGIATILKVPIRDLYPTDLEEWIARSTVYLSDMLRRPVGNCRLTLCQARAYASFRLAKCSCHTMVPTSSDVEARLVTLDPELRSTIAVVCKAIGPGLAEIDRAKMRGSHG